MRWINTRWGIATSLAGVLLVSTFGILWNREIDVEEQRPAELGSFTTEASSVRESPSNADRWSEDLARVADDVAALRAEVKRLEVVVSSALKPKSTFIEDENRDSYYRYCWPGGQPATQWR